MSAENGWLHKDRMLRKGESLWQSRNIRRYNVYAY